MAASWEYCNTTLAYCYALSPVQYINLTTYQWRVNPLPPPSNLTVINGTLANGTIINGEPYSGTEINGTYIIERVQPSTIGSLPLMSFIYMAMTLLVILLMAYPVIEWILVVVGQRQYKGAPFLPTSPDALSEGQFNTQIRSHYHPSQVTRLGSNAGAVPLRSFAEISRLRSNAGTAQLRSYAETTFGNLSGKCTPQGLQEFRELMQKKYRMDIQIYNSQFMDGRSIPLVEDLKRRSRGATVDMLKCVQQWGENRQAWSDEEWHQIREIIKAIKQLDQAERARVEREGFQAPR